MASPNQSLGDLAQAAIAKYVKQATRREEAVLADTDPEELHQMRVGMRRLRTALHVFQPVIVIPKVGREPRVAEVARALGKLRDFDVIAETLRSEYQPQLPPKEANALKSTLATLGEQRRHRFKEVQHLLKGNRYQSLKKSLKDWVKEPKLKAIASLPAQIAIPDLALPLISQLWLHPGWLVGTTENLQINAQIDATAADQLIAQNSETLHSLRKQIKRVRYQLTLIADLYGNALKSTLDDLETMQEALGQLQDSLVLAEFLKTAVADAPIKMPTLFSLLTEGHHRAWQPWQALQKTYLEPATRHQLRLSLLQPKDSTIEGDSDTPSPTKSRSQPAHIPHRVSNHKGFGR